ncbi:endosomal integral membrane protein [Angomonas deanei]|uniref:Transmembrane 9 superfamily member n=1 Tax=Angomonas deanei TaxID=59799 RepID=A0A7G2CIT9_9TRYP|nr:endosomal integral membrane protein [Angomonas deanei]CAD2218543.1 Endomembrane protein 70, putative [Angomonas deanei]|eukprot:EPY30276.1 endosomal integral membrane protein [Angomonas deanei]
MNLTMAINMEYRGALSIDNLPTFMHENRFKEMRNFQCSLPTVLSGYLYAQQRGYPLGIPASCGGVTGTVVFNHLDFVIEYNTKDGKAVEAGKESETEYMVVGLSAYPNSIRWQPEDVNREDGKSKKAEPQEEGEGPTTTAPGDETSAPTSEAKESAKGDDTPSQEETTLPEDDDDLPIRELLTNRDLWDNNYQVRWSYSVTWVKSDVLWASRWDQYLSSSYSHNDDSVHYTYASFSVVAVVLVAALTFLVLARVLHKDFNRYDHEDPDDLQEETGWKLIHADVFRPPDRAYLLSVLVGNGYQVVGMCTGVFILALMGLLSPSRRGALLTSTLVLAVLMSVFSGYVCGVLLKYLNCQSWKHVLLCAFAVPGAVCATIFFVDIINLAKGATTSLPFTVILSIFMLWVFVSAPLTILGAGVAFKQPTMVNPVAVGRLAREIPYRNMGCCNSPAFMILIAPLVPFVTILVELYFVMEGAWAGQVYYAFGFLSFVGFLWVVVCALTTVFFLYYVLCLENHRWWWLAFMIPGGMGLHLFAFSIYFFFHSLYITNFASGVLYFAYMGLVSFLYGIAAGAIGLTAGILFVRTIYARIKVD